MLTLHRAILTAGAWLFLTTQALAQDLDSLEIEGTSHAEEMDAFTSMIVTVAHLAEDWLFPASAIILLGLSAFKLYQRDFMQSGLAMAAAVMLAAIPYFMSSLQVFTTS